MYKYNFIYKTTNLINGKAYVGKHQTNNLDDGYLGSGIAILNSVEKHGKENFKCEVLEKCIPCNAFIVNREEFWIDNENTLKPNGYNLTKKSGGGNLGKYVNKKISEALKGKPLKKSIVDKMRDGRRKGENNSRYGAVLSQEQIDKAKATFKKNYKKENHPLYGKPCPENVKEKMRIANTGKVRTNEAKIKQSESIRKNGGSWNKGVKCSDEAKRKISETQQNLPIKKCKYCDFESKSVGNMNRWHNDNCKFK